MKRTGIAVLSAVLLCGGYVGQSFAAQPPGYDNRTQAPYDNRNQGPYDNRNQGPYDNRNQGAYDNRDRGWDTPPNEFRDEIQRRGFRDGIDGAQKDFGNHRAPNVNNRDEYRHPQGIPGGMRDQYRRAFRRGYDVAVHRLMDRHDDRDHRDDGYRR